MAARGAMVDIRFQGMDAALSAVGALPKQIERARKRALGKLLTFTKREVARVVAGIIGVPQRNFLALARLSTKRQASGAVEIWIGTNPIAAQYLGRVTWKRSWTGARAGRKQFPGAWSWVDKPGAKTGAAIMHRNGGRYQVAGVTRAGISEVKVDIHEQVKARLPEIERAVMARFQVLLAQEINYAVRVERAA